MARKTPSTSVRVRIDIADRAEHPCKVLRWSFNQFCEYAIENLCEMIESTEKRVLPDVVLQIDALRIPREMLRNSEICGPLKGSEDGHAQKKHA